MRRLLVVAMLGLFAAPAARAADRLLWGDLQPGPFRVGFRVDRQADASRAERPRTTLEEMPAKGSPLRTIEITMWYPARPSSAQPIRFGDYMTYADDIVSDRAEDRAAPADLETRRKNAIHGFATFAIFNETPESSWSPILDSKMLAVLDAAPASGRFPVILHAPGANGTSVLVATTCEYLASHGYVILSVPSRGQDALNDRTSGGAFFESQARDLEYALAYATRLEFADASRAGIFAWSRGGAAALLLAMRDSRMSAVVGYDASAIETKREADRLHESPFYDPDRLTVPILEIRAGNSGTAPLLFDSLRFAPRYWINASGMHHLDFSVAAMIHAAFGLQNQYIKLSPEKTRAAYAAINVATQRFFDAFVKSKGTFSADGLPPPDVFSNGSLEAALPPPSPALLLERIYATKGIESARSIIDATRRTSPQWRPFPEFVLDTVGSRMIELRRNEEAIQVLELNTNLYPDSTRVWGSLGLAQEKVGYKGLAVESFRKALTIDPKNEVATTGLARLQKSE